MRYLILALALLGACFDPPEGIPLNEACEAEAAQWCDVWRDTFYSSDPDFGGACEQWSISDCVDRPEPVEAVMGSDHDLCLETIESQRGDWTKAGLVPAECNW